MLHARFRGIQLQEAEHDFLNSGTFPLRKEICLRRTSLPAAMEENYGLWVKFVGILAPYPGSTSGTLPHFLFDEGKRITLSVFIIETVPPTRARVRCANTCSCARRKTRGILHCNSSLSAGRASTGYLPTATRTDPRSSKCQFWKVGGAGSGPPALIHTPKI